MVCGLTLLVVPFRLITICVGIIWLMQNLPDLVYLALFCPPGSLQQKTHRQIKFSTSYHK